MISVVVPVYNVENYLRRCVDSILSQSFQDFEIILIDDGSRDSSPEICDEYSKENSDKIRVIHQKNSGLSITRNVGTEIAKGNYITYVDSDDLIHPDYLNDLYSLCVDNEADLSCCNFSFFSYEDEIDFSFSEKKQNYVLTGIEAMNSMLYGKLHGSSACALLIKSDIAKKIKFKAGKYHEDDLISFQYFVNAKKVGITSKKMYYYFQRPGSIMHAPYGQIAIDELDAGDYILKNCMQYGKKSEKAASYKKYSNYVDVFTRYPELKKEDKNTFYRIKNELKILSCVIFKDKNIGKKMRLKAFILRLFGIKIFSILNKYL